MLEKLSNFMLPEIEDALQDVLTLADSPETGELYAMLAYHMGWESEEPGTNKGGKRIRPLLLLLTCGAAGGDWQEALPAAAAVELIHNFSLIHDDIEDNSPLRRGRTTVWKRWGIPQAINSGDTMFTLGSLAMLKLSQTCASDVVLAAMDTLQQTCLELTQGQYLDLAYEKRDDLSIDHYWKMIRGKTASLIGACTYIGSIVAGCSPEIQTDYHEFGLSLGLAFQMQDDLLGIWGKPHQTGKSAESDLISGKKSLPILYGLSQGGEFADRWKSRQITSENVGEIAQLLENSGAKDYAQERASYYTQESLRYLNLAQPKDDYSKALIELADLLLNREV